MLTRRPRGGPCLHHWLVGGWGYVTAVFPGCVINIKQRQYYLGLGGHVSVGCKPIMGRETRGLEVFLHGPECLRW